MARQRTDAAPERLWIYGRHAVAAALANPARRTRRIAATRNALAWLAEAGAPLAEVHLDEMKPAAIDALLHEGAVHQGLAAEVFDLPRARLRETCETPETGAPVVVLDQITDPRNIGAVFRSAAAFNARAIVVQDRRTPPLAGALAKAAAGGIERTPCVRVVNIARALEALGDLGYGVVGLAGEAETPIDEALGEGPVALALGAEGSGLRPLVAKSCARLARIPISQSAESLNVSNAAAIALYASAARTRRARN